MDRRQPRPKWWGAQICWAGETFRCSSDTADFEAVESFCRAVKAQAKRELQQQLGIVEAEERVAPSDVEKARFAQVNDKVLLTEVMNEYSKGLNVDGKLGWITTMCDGNRKYADYPYKVVLDPKRVSALGDH